MVFLEDSRLVDGEIRDSVQWRKESGVDTLKVIEVPSPVVTHSAYDMKVIMKMVGVWGRLNLFREFSVICKHESLGKFEKNVIHEYG